MNNTTKFLAGLLAGVGVGTVLGLLIAPDKGTNTYRRIEGAVKDVAHDLTDKSNDLLKSAREKAETVAKKV
ncbi:YtxH domain-containing protein [Fulvivirga sedimenti]|jgi:gas vesicle protein|uniref:YtxH domain-containing protein n=1 Tax=Fulvivirga sedimenti TaxID=2879465 RepID=A0A9X1HWT4_9BACT|nr:YtxH domain-containing protein [Fulvivirga sedimenti]MCA6079251.1 YtxH domain-containing protein [Fulvivirga sedimenti]